MPQRIAEFILWIQRANREFVSLDVKPPPGSIALLIAFASLAIFFSSLERFGAALPSNPLRVNVERLLHLTFNTQH